MPVRLAHIRKSWNSIGRVVVRKEPSSTVCGNAIWFNRHFSPKWEFTSCRIQQLHFFHIYPQNTENINSKRYMHACVHCCAQYSSQGVETAQMPSWVHGSGMGCIH